MRREDSKYPGDWIRIAQKDWVRMETLLDIEDWDGAGFFLQQALEKYLKGYLLSKGWKLERIHDLESLLNSDLHYDSTFEEFRTLCQRVTGYYIIERYPVTQDSGLTESALQRSMEDAEKLVDKINDSMDKGS